MVDRIGQQFGNYQLIRPLGRGGFAEVYLGKHVYLKSLAAIKLLPAFMKSEDVEDFLAEAQILARLTHPHIVRVLDFALVEDTPFLVMDYAPHGTLRERHPKGARLSLETVISYVKQIAPALQYAHEQKLIHRDVKPENMLLGGNDDVLLSDFGIAAIIRTTGSLTTERVAGTLPYMAPEQLSGKLNRACDQYALGVVVYEWLSGERPFQGSQVEIISQHLSTLPPPLRAKVPLISPGIEQVVMKALAKEPGQRFPSVQDFAAALERASQMPEQIGPVYLTNQSSHSAVTEVSSNPPPHQAKPTPFLGVSPQPLTGSDTKLVSIKQRKGLSRGKIALLVSLILIVISGSLGLFYSFLSKSIVPPSSTPTATSSLYITPTPDPPSAASSDYAMFGYNPQHTHFNPSETVLSPSNVSGLVQDWIGNTGYSIYSSPTITNGVVYVGSEDGELYAFDVATHKRFWPPTFTGGAIYSSPAIAKGVVYVGSANHKLYAFNASTGQPFWQAPAITGGEIKSSPVIAKGVVYIGSYDSHLYAFDASTGQPFWSTPASTRGVIESSPAVANGVVYVGSDDGNLYAFDANNGSQLWYATTGNFMVSSPAVADDIVYVGSADHNFYAFSASGCGKPFCSALWHYTTGNRILSSPAIANGVVYVGSDDYKLYAFDAHNGTVLWTSNPAGDSFFSSPVVANGVVYIGSFDNDLYAFNASGCGKPSCSALWHYTTGNRIFSSPAIANGVVYVGSYDKKLYAFHLPRTTP